MNVDYSKMSDTELINIISNFADEFEATGNISETTRQTEPQPINGMAWEDVEISLIDDAEDGLTSGFAPIDVDTSPQNASYSFNNNNEVILNNIRPIQQRHVFRITPDKVAFPDYANMSFLQKRRAVLFESNFGMSYSYKKSWEALLNAVIKEFGNATLINTFGIRDGLLLAKKLEIDPYNFTDDRLGITLYDMIEYHTLFKMLPMIETLALDEKATQRLINVYGETADSIWEVFQEAHNLRVLKIKTCEGWKIHNRETFRQTASQLDKELVESRARSELQHAADVRNRHIDEKGKGYIYGVKQNAKEMKQHSFGVAKEAFMEKRPKLFRSIIYTGLGAGLAVVGFTASITGGLWQLFRKK